MTWLLDSYAKGGNIAAWDHSSSARSLPAKGRRTFFSTNPKGVPKGWVSPRSLVTVGVAVSHSLLEQPEPTALHAVPSTALLNDELSTQSAQVRSVVVEPSATWPLPLLHRVHSVHENESFCGAM